MRYPFNLAEADTFVPDVEGTDLPNDEAAGAQARTMS